MVVTVLLLASGAAVLTLGAESAVKGAARLADRRSWSPFLLGAVLFGIDVESVGVAIVAAARNQPAIAAGEAFGTVLFLVAVGFGAALLTSPRPVPAPSGPMVLLPGAAVVAGGLAVSDLLVTRAEGAVLVAAYLAYVAFVLQDGRGAKARAEEVQRGAAEGPRLPPPVLLVGGLALVYVGATVLVSGGVRILDRTPLQAGFVGAAIVGALASLDEVFLEVVPVLRGLPDLATGNLFGTVAAFTTGALGVAALVRPLAVDSATTTAFLALAVVYTVVATVFAARGRAGRITGALLLGVFTLWLAYSSRL